MDRSDLASLVDDLACESVYSLADDVYHYDRMTEAICVRDDGEYLTLRVYDTPASVGQVLQYMDDQLSQARQVLVGENWFAIGDPSDLEDVAERLNVAPEYGVEVPRAQELTHEQSGIRACSVGVVTIIRNSIGGTDDAQMTFSYEQVFPGVTELSDRLTAVLRSAGIDDPLSTEFEQAVAENGSEIKSACAAALESGMNQR